MRHSAYILTMLLLCVVFASCENDALVGASSDDFAAPTQLANSKWSATIDGFRVTISYSGELQGGGASSGAAFGELMVAKNMDMTRTIATSDLAIVGAKARGSVTFTLDGAGEYYARALVGRTEYVFLASPVYTYKTSIPVLDTQISELSWLGVTVSPGTVELFGLPCIGSGIIYSCDRNKMLLETANRSLAVALSGSSFSKHVSVDFAAEDAGLDKANAPTYYVRTYATTSAGTGYGPIVEFSTIRWPAISNVYVTDITSNSARLNYTLTPASNDITTITEKVAYGTGSSMSGSTIVKGHDMTGLTPNTTYYCRYYFSNNYGENIWRTEGISFTTASSTGLSSGQNY